MTIPLITGQFDISQGGINNLVNKTNLALGAIVQFQNLTGAITSVGPITSLGSFTSLQLKTALTDETGSGVAVFANSPTLVSPALGTPTALVGTNITGTASGLTAGSVTTNANLTGAITSTGNATSLGSFSSANLASALTDETGSGLAVFATSPTLVTPILGIAAATSINKVAFTAPATSATLVLADGKTLTANNTLTLTGTDATSINLTNAKIKTMGFSSTNPSLATGQQGSFIVCPVAGTITGWNIVADAGIATVQVWKIANGTAKPTVANNINTVGVSLATGTAIESTTVSDFTTITVAAGDIFAFNLSSVSGMTNILFQLQISVN